jgi:hypothetical protein
MQGNSVDFKSGCSVHIEYQPKDLEELRKVCSLLKEYQGAFQVTPADQHKGGNGHGNGNGNGKRSVLSKETLDELFDLAREKNVFLKKMSLEMFGKKVTDLYGGEAREIKEELLTY